MKAIITLLVVILPSIVLAASGGHGGHDNEIPKVTIYQVINLVILFAGIIYYTKDAVISLFSTRKMAYIEAANKAAAARAEAEKNFADIKSKLENLDKNRAADIEKAKKQAEDLKAQLRQEAQNISNKIKADAELTVKLESERAQRELRTQLLKDSVEAARVVLTKDISAADQDKLQKEFINKVGV